MNDTPENDDQAPDATEPERRDREAEAAEQAAADTPLDDQIPAEELETGENPAEPDITPESDSTSGSEPDEQDPADPVAPPETGDAPAADEPIGPSESAAASGIEAAAEAAAAEDPAPPAEATPPAETPEPAPAVAMPKQGAKAQASTRRKQTGKPDAVPNANAAHLATKLANRPEPPPPPPKTDEQIAADQKKAETRAELDAIAAELATIDEAREELIARQQELANPTPATAEARPFHVIHREVLQRSKEIREQRVRDRLKLLAKGAGMSPLDRALGERKIDVDPQPATTE